MMIKKITYLTLFLTLCLQSALFAQQAPTVSSFSPTVVTHRTAITINGTNFTPAMASPVPTNSVRFNIPGGTLATAKQALAVTYISPTQIRATVPDINAAGSGLDATRTFVVTTTNGTATSGTFTYSAPAPTPANAGITNVVTNWAGATTPGYWSSSTTSNVAANQPDTNHSLVAFNYNGVRYSTGNESNITSVLTSAGLQSGNGSGTTYVTGNWRALPINNIEGTVPTSTGDPNLIVLASKIDGSSTAQVATAPTVAGLSVRDVLIDGIRGLNLG
ncbi:MAG: hypothetical protein EOO45_24635, partial [Flavobacterium sp.]